MTQSQKTAIIISSFIVMFIDLFLKKEHKFRASTINLRQKILLKIKNEEYNHLQPLGNKIWQNIVDKYKDKEAAIVVFDAVEFLAYETEQEMKTIYNQDFFNFIDRFVLKESFTTQKQYLQDTRKFVEDIIKETKTTLKETQIC